ALRRSRGSSGARQSRSHVMDARSPILLCIAIVTSAVFALGSCGQTLPSAAPNPGLAGNVVRSNITPHDHAGSEACRACHESIYQRWLASPMHNMTRDAKTAVIRAPFDGRELHFMSDSATLSEHDGQRFMSVRSASEGESVYRVSKVIGGRY